MSMVVNQKKVIFLLLCNPRFQSYFERKSLSWHRAKGVEGSTVYTYVAPGHNECVPTRLHDPADVDGGKMIQGITYFIPGGGCDYGANPLESIYYILEGQMTLKTEDGETVLNAGDSFHCCGGCPKSVTNNGTTVTKMLVTLLPPQA